MAGENPRMRIKQELVNEAAKRGHTVTSLLEYFLANEKTQMQALSFQLSKLISVLSSRIPSEEELTYLRITLEEIKRQ